MAEDEKKPEGEPSTAPAEGEKKAKETLKVSSEDVMAVAYCREYLKDVQEHCAKDGGNMIKGLKLDTTLGTRNACCCAAS